MACEVCEHCNTAVRPHEAVVREGYSYHARCHKCYVCSETNLQDADIFKGVIFCSGCSNRIFQGCSTARRGRTRRSHRPAYKEYKKREKSLYDKGYNKYATRVLELARLTGADSQSLSGHSKDFLTSTAPSTVATALTNHTYQMKPYQVPKCSAEIGTTTTVTKELLKRIHSPIESKGATPAMPRKKQKSRRENNHKNYCSDLRIAELGASTEIAHVALRKPSEVPIIIKSEISLKRSRTHSLCNLTQESNVSGVGDSKRSTSSAYSSTIANNGHCKNCTIGSLLTLPYRLFKRNILDKSSLISVLMSSRESECIINKIRFLFQHEITEHQRRGLRRLFSTINRRKELYKLGWLDVMKQIPEDERLPGFTKRERRCRHFKQSHSYRCMRTQVMRLAGPTRSELAVIREKMKNAVCFDLCKLFRVFTEQYINILKSIVGKQTRRIIAPLRRVSTCTLRNVESI